MLQRKEGTLKKFLLSLLLSSSLFSKDLCSNLLSLTSDDKQYSYINELCSSVPDNANLFLELYFDIDEVSKEELSLFLDKNLYKNGKSVFKIYTDKKYIDTWLKLFTKQEVNSYEKDLLKLKEEVRRELYITALKSRKIKRDYLQDSKCISGTLIEGNLIVPLNINEFITIEEREEIILRWYYDNHQCNLIEKFKKIKLREEEFRSLDIKKGAF